MKKPKRSKLISVWSLSYFLLLALFVVSITSVSLVSQSVSRKINDKYCQTLFGGISQNATEMIEKSNLIYSTLVNFKELGKVLEVDGIDGYYTEKSVMALIEDLRNVKGNVDYYIYLPKTDTVLSDSGFFKSAIYHKVRMSEYNLTYEEWMEKLHRQTSAETVSATNIDSSDIFLREKYSSENGIQMHLVTKLNEEALLDVETLPEWIDESDIYISNLNGEVYMSRGDAERTQRCTNIAQVDSLYTDSWEIFSKTEFSMLPMVVSIVYPRQAAWTELSFLVRLQIIMCVALILISLLVIVFVIRKNYKPIVSIMKTLNAENNGDELSSIQKNIHELLSTNKNYLKQVEKFAEENVQTVLTRCLSGNYSQSAVQKMLRENSISFPYGHFTLCAFDIANVDELFAGDEAVITTEQKFKDLNFILHNILSELFEQYECHVKIATVDEKVFAIINMQDKAQFDCGTVYEVLKYGLDFIKQHFTVNVSFVLTKTYSSIGALPEAYAQALYLLRYKTAMGIKNPFSINDIEYGSEEQADIVLDSETEQKLINSIAGGNFENAQFLLDHIFTNLQGMGLPLEQKQCYMIDLGCMLCKIPQKEVKVDFEKILNYSANPSAMQEFLRTAIRQMCDKGRVTVIKSDKIGQVKEYIDAKYYEDFDLNSLSYMFNISQNYLSASFKKEVGVSITDYINNTRIHYAKQFLKNTDKSIKDIAEKVGYKNIRTFNRLFQKHEGITPTIYRNNIK